MSLAQKPVIHGRDHSHGGADPVQIAWEDVGSGAGGSGGGIQFDTDNVGGWLSVQTTGYDSGGYGVHFITSAAFVVEAGGIELKTPDGGGQSFTVTADDFGFYGGSGLPDSTSVDFAVNVGGHIVLNGGAASFALQPGAVQLLTYTDRITLVAQGGADVLLWPTSGSIVFGDPAHPVLVVTNYGGAPTYHVRAGAAWAADL